MDFLEMMHADSMREAAGLLARRGYDNVQAAGLAQAMRMSVGSMYRHYGSKRGLALAVRDFTEKQLSYQGYVAFALKHGKPGVDFAQAFLAFWWELAGWALRQPGLFHFTFLHWHAHEYGPHSPPAPGPRVAGALIPQQSNGGATRALVREVLEKGEREGALAPGGAQVGEGLVWGALVELARTAAQGGARVGEAEVLASARALWRALAREEDSGPRGTGTPSPGVAESSPAAPGGLAAMPASVPSESPVAAARPEGQADEAFRVQPEAPVTGDSGPAVEAPCVHLAATATGGAGPAVEEVRRVQREAPVTGDSAPAATILHVHLEAAVPALLRQVEWVRSPVHPAAAPAIRSRTAPAPSRQCPLPRWPSRHPPRRCALLRWLQRPGVRAPLLGHRELPGTVGDRPSSRQPPAAVLQHRPPGRSA
jgi:AcrR family transcriptional regulator